MARALPASSVLVDPTATPPHGRPYTRLERGLLAEQADAIGVLAKALGYPAYEPGEHGHSDEQVNYVIADHTVTTLAMEAAAIVESARAREIPREMSTDYLAIRGALDRIVAAHEGSTLREVIWHYYTARREDLSALVEALAEIEALRACEPQTANG